MSKKFSSIMTRLTLKLWPLIILVSLVLGAVSYPKMIYLYKHITTDPIDLLPHGYPNVETLIEIREKFQRANRVAIVLESDHPEKTVSYMKGLAERLQAEPTVGKTIYEKVGYNFFDKYKLLFIEMEDLKTIRDRIDRRIQREKLGGLLIDFEEESSGTEEFQFGDLDKKYRNQYSDATRSRYFQNEEGTIYSLYIDAKNPGTGLKDVSKFYEQLASFLSSERPEAFEPSLKLYLAGPAKVLEYRALVRDLKIAGIISGIFIFLPLLFRFRNPVTVLLIFLPLLLGVPMSFAVGFYLVGQLNIITSFMFAILGGLGIETGIHVYSRYHQARRAGHPPEEAFHQVFGIVARAVVTAVVSVAATFLLLTVNDFRGFYEFGLIAGIGLCIIFLLYFTFFPALLVFAEKVHILKFQKLTEVTPSSYTLSQSLLRTGLAVFILFSLYSLAAPFLVQFEYDSQKIRADIPEVRVAKEKQRTTSTRLNSPAVVIVNSREEAIALKDAFKERKKEDQGSPTIDTTRSYYDLTPDDQEQKMSVIGDMQKMLEDKTIRLVKGERKKDLDEFKSALKKTEPFVEETVPQEVKDMFLGKKNMPGALFFINANPDLELDDGRNAIHFAKDVSEIKTAFKTYYPSSDANIFGMMLITMFSDVPRILSLSLLSVLFFVFLDFKKIRETSLVVASILMGVFWLFGIMVLFGLKLNFYNMVIIPTVMGISIDNAIHVMHRYKELGKGSIREVIKSTGVTCLLASLTNAGGFAGLLFTIHKGLFSIGLLAVLGVATCLLSTLVFLPLVLILLEKTKIKN